ncbi:YidH family protein [Candidatus Clostridium helianthi]|uniref:YidH family protein n=1 Tax=Candidatus Clostridium helianthi TaxID=3381660 RepID=A0ABW8RZR7_9CLOT
MIEKEKTEKIYNFNKDKMILRDFLAADRTHLANERTLLAYMRTGLGTFALAISLIKLFDTNFTYVLGIIFIALSVISIILGIYRYKKINKKIENVLYK